MRFASPSSLFWRTAQTPSESKRLGSEDAVRPPYREDQGESIGKHDDTTTCGGDWRIGWLRASREGPGSTHSIEELGLGRGRGREAALPERDPAAHTRSRSLESDGAREEKLCFPMGKPAAPQQRRGGQGLGRNSRKERREG